MKATGFLGIFLLLSSLNGSHAEDFTTLYSFNLRGPACPSPLVRATDGNLYGMARCGGVLFELPANGELVISASSNNVFGPLGALVQRAYDGRFYGTAAFSTYGGIISVGTNGPAGISATFSLTNGSLPVAELVEGKDGNFYGTTAYGGTNGGWGTVFKVTFNSRITSLHSFSNGDDGAYPQAGLVLGADGAFYGTTANGGANNAGTIFKITTNGTLTVLYSFTGGHDGNSPVGSLLQATDGTFYGTTQLGGTNHVQNGGDGTVFKITQAGVFTSLASFNGTNGRSPRGRLILASDENFYGTALGGGFGFDGMSSFGGGTIFRFKTNGEITALHLFGALTNNGTSLDGRTVMPGLVQGSDGALYGSTDWEGTNGGGTIFRLTITSQAVPFFHSVTATGATITFSWSSIPGRTYQLQYCTNLNQLGWIDLGLPLVATGNVAVASESLAPPAPQRFYRVELLP